MSTDRLELGTRTGLKLVVRSATADDDPILDELFHHIDKADLRFRFLTTIKEVSAVRIHEMTHPDHRTTETYIAFANGFADAVATAMLASQPGGDIGEVAISVRADYRNKGIGWALLDFVARQAKIRGLKVVQSMESRENHDAIRLEREMGFCAKPCPEDPTLVLLSKTLN